MSRHSLQPGYQLHWYVIREILGQGGFGITYLADDTNLNQRVAIKEYLPTELAVREQDDSVHPVSGEHGEQFKWGLDRFIREAQTLAQFKHHNIVRVLTVFADNNTAYMVMEYEEGRAFHDILKDKKTIPEGEQLQILMPLLDGLEKIHAMGFIHRDIKPANIYIRTDGSPVLLDFGSARQALGHQTRTLTTMVSPGFAPFEQYVSKSDKQGPWTDIYGLGATLYRASIGRSPANAMDRSESLLHTGQDVLVPAMVVKPEGYSEPFLQAIDHALKFKADDRPQTITEWRQGLAGIIADPEADTEIASSSETVSPDAEAKTFQADTNSEADAAVTDVAPVKAAFFQRVINLFKKIIKWGALLLAVLFLLSLCKERNKAVNDDQRALAEPPAIEQPVQPETAPPAGPEADISLPGPQTGTSPQQVNSQIAGLLNAAGNDIQALRLTSPPGNNAVEKYYQVLHLEPFNEEARKGLKNVADKYLGLMDGALDRNELQKAQHYLTKASQVDPGHPGLNEARLKLQAASATQTRQEQAAMEGPVSDSPPVFDQGKEMDTPAITEEETVKTDQPGLMTEFERKTIERIKEQLRKNPNDKTAQRRARRVVKNFERKVKSALEDGEFAVAETYVREALEMAPKNKGLQEALDKILNIRQQTGQ